MKPVILISASTHGRGVEFGDYSLNLSMRYPAAILAAGGTPVVAACLPDAAYVTEAVRAADGIMLTGGDDVAPGLYRSKLPAKLAKTVSPPVPERDLFELMLIEEVFRQRKPLFAICRGHQILNVALGGTLLVDIPAQRPKALNHSRSDKKNDIVHEVKVEAGSILAQVTGMCRLGVNSSHHQAVEKVAKPLRATAVSIDGIVECMELELEYRQLLPYLLAVQFHPERLFAAHGEHLGLFRSFTEICRCRGGKKV